MDIDSVKMSFGYHSTAGLDKAQKQKVVLINIANTLGAIPIIGSIVGIARGIFFGYMMAKHRMTPRDKTFCYAQIFRSVIEGFSLGALFIVADVLVALERFKGNKAQIEAPNNNEPRVEEIDIGEEEEVLEEELETPQEEEVFEQPEEELQVACRFPLTGSCGMTSKTAKDANFYPLLAAMRGFGN